MSISIDTDDDNITTTNLDSEYVVKTDNSQLQDLPPNVRKIIDQASGKYIDNTINNVLTNVTSNYDDTDSSYIVDNTESDNDSDNTKSSYVVDSTKSDSDSDSTKSDSDSDSTKSDSDTSLDDKNGIIGGGEHIFLMTGGSDYIHTGLDDIVGPYDNYFSI